MLPYVCHISRIDVVFREGRKRYVRRLLFCCFSSFGKRIKRFDYYYYHYYLLIEVGVEEYEGRYIHINQREYDFDLSYRTFNARKKMSYGGNIPVDSIETT